MAEEKEGRRKDCNVSFTTFIGARIVTDTTNEVPTPAGMTDAQFTALVLAKQGAAGMLADVNERASLLASSVLWWDSLGDYFREELLAQSTGDLHAAFTALAEVQTKPVLTVTAEQDAAATASLANAAADTKASTAVSAPAAPTPTTPAPKIVSVTPPVIPTPLNPDAKPAPAKVVVQSGESFFEHVGEDIHDAITKAVAWIESLAKKL